MRFTVILEPSDDGGYTVFVPALPGCISEGETKKEVLADIRKAIELYLEPLSGTCCWTRGPRHCAVSAH